MSSVFLLPLNRIETIAYRKNLLFVNLKTKKNLWREQCTSTLKWYSTK